jgi:hypothetical protein
MTTAIRMTEALSRLDMLLPQKAPELAATLLPPASDSDLEQLRVAVMPFVLPDDLVELYRWHDGQDAAQRVWWPVISTGALFGIADAIKYYEIIVLEEVKNTDEWRRSWFPIAAEGWSRSLIDMGDEAHGLIIDASSPDMPTPQAPSLTALMHATCEVLAADLPLDLEATARYDETEGIAAAVYSAYERPDKEGYWTREGYGL